MEPGSGRPRGGVSTGTRLVGWVILSVVCIALFLVAGVVLLSLFSPGVFESDSHGDPGELEAALYEWDASDGPLPVFADASTEWGFSSWIPRPLGEMSGGAAIEDLNGDGLADVILVGGTVGLFLGSESGFNQIEVEFLGQPDVTTSVNLFDVDVDGAVDILLGAAEGNDLIIWGGPWLEDIETSSAETTTLPGSDMTTALLAADVSGDERPDIVRLASGLRPTPPPDVVFTQGRPREFQQDALPDSERRSLAGELADIDGDGLLDIWVTRDVGWQDGGDSLYSRLGNAEGPWSDIAEEMGTDLEIDGMGITLTDLNADARLDAVVSDLGDNEVLVSNEGSFELLPGTGVERIRPPTADGSAISSSWASGTTDLNHDGRLDLVIANGGFVSNEIPNKIHDTEIQRDDAPAVLLQREDGRYADVWPQLGISWNGASRGMAIGDLDNDGDSDLLFVNHNRPPVALRNDTPGPTSTLLPAKAGCDTAGLIVRAETDQGVSTTLLRHHTFLGVHQPQFVLGVAQRTAIEVLTLGGDSLPTETAGDGDRVEVEFEC
jgi:hypothetical protein